MPLLRKDCGFDERSTGGKAANRRRSEGQFGAFLSSVLGLLLGFPHVYLQVLLVVWYFDTGLEGVYDPMYFYGSILIVAINSYFIYRGSVIAVIGLCVGLIPPIFVFCLWLLGAIFRAIF